MTERLTPSAEGELAARLRDAELGRQRAEARLQFNEALARCVLDSTIVGIVQVDLSGRAVYVNAHARRYLELNDRPLHDLNLRDMELRTLRPDGSPHRYEDFVITRCLQTGQPQPATTIGVRMSSGETVWGVASAAPVINAETGAMEGVISTFVNTTHAHELEQTVRQSDDRYLRLTELAPNAMLIHDRGNLKYVNPACVRLWGAKTREDLIGRHFRDFVHPRYRKASTRRMQLVLQGSSVPWMEQIHIRMNGSLVRVEVATTPCIYNGKPCAQSILRELGREEREEKRRRKQKRLLKKFFERLPMFAALVSATGRMQLVNQRWRDVLGWERGWSIVERFDQWLSHDDEKLIAKKLVTGALGTWQDFKVRAPGGRMVDIAFTVLPLTHGRRMLVGQDITSRVAAERHLHDANAEMQRRLEAHGGLLVRKTAELIAEIAERRAAEGELKKKQRFLEQLLRELELDRQLVAFEVHDSVLQDVIGAQMFIDTLIDSGGGSVEERTRLLEQARTSLVKAVAEARNLIAGLRPRIVDQQGLVAGIEHLIGEAGKRGLQIDFQVPSEFPRLSPQAELALFRIAQEGLKNIEKHSQAHTGSVSLVCLGDRLRLEIRDSGRGFDQALVPHDHFGLQGIAERARLAGGIAKIESHPGAGTLVAVEMPINLADQSV